MSERLKYVSPEYQEQLEGLGDLLMEGVRNRLAEAALQDTVEIPVISGQLELDYGGEES